MKNFVTDTGNFVPWLEILVEIIFICRLLTYLKIWKEKSVLTKLTYLHNYKVCIFFISQYIEWYGESASEHWLLSTVWCSRCPVDWCGTPQVLCSDQGNSRARSETGQFTYKYRKNWKKLDLRKIAVIILNLKSVVAMHIFIQKMHKEWQIHYYSRELYFC